MNKKFNIRINCPKNYEEYIGFPEMPIIERICRERVIFIEKALIKCIINGFTGVIIEDIFEDNKVSFKATPTNEFNGVVTRGFQKKFEL